MRFLLDTQILLWSVLDPERLGQEAQRLIETETNQIHFSVASIWEIAIKYALKKPSFTVDPRAFRDTIIERGFREFPVEADDVIAVADLPPLHGDPFDRLLVAQSMSRMIPLLSRDRHIARYPGPIWRV